MDRSDEIEAPLSSPLPDVSHIDLTELRAEEGSVLQGALDRLLAASESHDVVAGFNAAL
ncbi:hypothetical protein [Kineosporia babensis]|uniref:FXSXX-COOH protein n=1 Tax=Kineosporia babensis TaxID=499548 RepID=A0A9X1NH68_9ACTN|nr:hypothetical protein [Kineosporia babensis]MCD5315032.1 hypothetical protein [Kineosporia babensis]